MYGWKDWGGAAGAGKGLARAAAAGAGGGPGGGRPPTLAYGSSGFPSLLPGSGTDALGAAATPPAPGAGGGPPLDDDAAVCMPRMCKNSRLAMASPYRSAVAEMSSLIMSADIPMLDAACVMVTFNSCFCATNSCAVSILRKELNRLIYSGLSIMSLYFSAGGLVLTADWPSMSSNVGTWAKPGPTSLRAMLYLLLRLL